MTVFFDWGSTRVRGYLVERGSLSKVYESTAGSKALQGSGETYQAELNRALDHFGVGPEVPIRISGMAGSKVGWSEAPYVDTPIDAAGFANNFLKIDGYRNLRIYGGLRHIPLGGGMDVMRGEEVQIFGLLKLHPEARVVCLPGTHSKWAKVEGASVTGFRTHMTGDLFHALAEQTIFREQIGGKDFHEEGFLHGCSLADQGNGLDDLFKLRTEYLSAAVTSESFFSCFSGFLIANEVRAVGVDEPVWLCGSEELTNLYALALKQASIESVLVNAEDATIQGHITLNQE